ncbi:Gfo/Idh/MocA family protein [Dermatophilus congolensis]|uniref:Uncharacterized oxidoreductase yvaA n=1 Tax=Dermatophilus congolensis TaxID=1863 RepID=A0A239VBQ7_9MICO|nr:Gfo/Idh/MocA family oxidoreductase [Dermatophilus congolensis]MBO3128518.1 Gfo/Idh/MocA family oxidoreductase [Dermatophilus congolensis]MBO3132846.1 Gfo/Idh/MocA family oxidoreductase [Dermatophilus congolensis]MBO3132995.1 Gfo/Idh/MocA family oxidoreductase [Dermatophilus congolensis]MBO3135231.1 Gfo/Idh/MocA family oxidoreductase [Dermatophilus congolensis]MBO3137469.1 Gfo/Idh/MocA family oxidoreductase [Dermatophilus congolensis]
MRIALAGYSYGRTLHAPLIAQAGGQIVAVATSHPDRVAQAKADLPGAVVVPDVTALVDAVANVGADAVVLCTPTGKHVEHVRQVIAAGVPCVVDKPMAVFADEADALVQLARQERVPLTVFQNRRWDAGPLALARVMQRGDLGQVRRFEMSFSRWRPEPKQRWRENADWREGGGVLNDLGPHVIDTAVQVMGPVASVYAEVNAFTTPADDDVLLWLRHVGGGSSILRASSFDPFPAPRFRVTGTKAAFVYEDGPDTIGVLPDLADAQGGTGWVYAGSERWPGPAVSETGAEFYRILSAALQVQGYEDRQAGMPVDPMDAVHSIRVGQAARLSAAQSRVVQVE